MPSSCLSHRITNSICTWRLYRIDPHLYQKVKPRLCCPSLSHYYQPVIKFSFSNLILPWFAGLPLFPAESISVYRLADVLSTITFEERPTNLQKLVPSKATLCSECVERIFASFTGSAIVYALLRWQQRWLQLHMDILTGSQWQRRQLDSRSQEQKKGTTAGWEKTEFSFPKQTLLKNRQALQPLIYFVRKGHGCFKIYLWLNFLTIFNTEATPPPGRHHKKVGNTRWVRPIFSVPTHTVVCANTRQVCSKVQCINNHHQCTTTGPMWMNLNCCVFIVVLP